eukprot:gene149-152_t
MGNFRGFGGFFRMAFGSERRSSDVFRDLFASFRTSFERHPFLFGVVVSSAKTGAADVVVQRYVERKDTLDYRRVALFGAWGAGWLGGVQYGLYVKCFGRLFPHAEAFALKPLAAKLLDRAGQKNVVKQVILDQFVHHPFGLFPAFYTLKTGMETDFSLGWNGTVRRAMALYRENWREDLMWCWRVWIPAFLLNFSFCPMWLRVPFVAAVSFGWTMLLSFLRGDPG